MAPSLRKKVRECPVTAEADEKQKAAMQLPLELGYGQASSRDDLLISASVAPAVELIDRWPDWLAPVVLLVGPPGAGKSHISGVWKSLSNAGDVSSAMRSGATSEHQGTAFLFEDADREAFDETALFHLINHVRQNNGTLLITARSLPGQWGVSLADLKSRLAAATVVEIGAPDDELLEQLVFKLFADRQLDVDDRVVRYIVTRMERSLEAARGIVEAIDKLALARGRRITRALAAEVLQQHD